MAEPEDTYGVSAKNNNQLDSPPKNHVAVVAHDSTNFTYLARAVYVGVGGDISVEMLGADGNPLSLVYKNVPSGSYLLGRIRRVNSTGTNATNMIAVW